MGVPIRSIVRELLPPLLLRAIRRAPAPATGITFSGNYAKWNDAVAASSGYNAQEILDRVEAATVRVLAGDKAFERDSVVFDSICHSFPVLAGLLRAAVENDGELSVLDFGGSLGSSFRQCRQYLSVVRKLDWRIVEQEHFVRRGRERFETDQLRFYGSIDEAVAESTPEVVLISSVVQYLETPYSMLNELSNSGSRYLIVDRTPFAGDSNDRLVVQQVPESIYPASYPCWIFSRERFVATLETEWEMLADYPSVDGVMAADGMRVEFGGMIMRRRS
jgi:putative methyltransferase (TIGR04325 family)